LKSTPGSAARRPPVRRRPLPAAGPPTPHVLFHPKAHRPHPWISIFPTTRGRRAQIRCADRRAIGAERETGWVHERTQAGTAASPPLRMRTSSLFTGPCCFFHPKQRSCPLFRRRVLPPPRSHERWKWNRAFPLKYFFLPSLRLPDPDLTIGWIWFVINQTIR
jgi:hypothetical protein